MIIVTRRRLLEAARALRDKGSIPPLVDDPELSFGARSGDLIAPEGQPWREAYDQALRQALHPGPCVPRSEPARGVAIAARHDPTADDYWRIDPDPSFPTCIRWCIEPQLRLA